jgi:hypothetical protein
MQGFSIINFSFVRASKKNKKNKKEDFSFVKVWRMEAKCG